MYVLVEIDREKRIITVTARDDEGEFLERIKLVKSWVDRAARRHFMNYGRYTRSMTEVDGKLHLQIGEYRTNPSHTPPQSIPLPKPKEIAAFRRQVEYLSDVFSCIR